MKTKKQPLNKASKILSKISNEISLAKPKSDEGLLPIYSLLTDLEDETPKKNNVLHKGITDIKAILEALMDTASPFQESTLSALADFMEWVRSNLGNKPDQWSELSININPTNADETTDSSAAEDEDLKAMDVLLEVDITQDAELLDEFQNESRDHLERIESGLLTLEGNPEDKEVINDLFRSFHTLKGLSGFLHFVPIKNLTHEVESLLDLARNDKIQLNSSIISIILKSRDTTQTFINQIAESIINKSTPTQLIPISGLISEIRQAATNTSASPTPQGSQTTQNQSAPANEPIATNTPTLASTSSNSIRVNTSKLDSLLDTVGELVIVQSQFQEHFLKELTEGTALARNLSQLTRITKTLQNSSMSLRMVPIRPCFQKVSRIVRDLSSELNKKVNLEISGEDTELDRNIVEEIGDPLVHMIRNAIDHGIESPEERVQAGKPETGNCYLKAYHLGNNIVIEITDDGKGIDHEQILKSAQEKKLVPYDQSFTPQEIYKFLFLPGFSTAKEVTEVSGRGVGMDVVLRNIEKLRGNVEIDSTLGQGSSFKIKIPLTMAIIDGLVLQVGKKKFVLPSASAETTFRPTAEQISTIQTKAEILTFQGRTIPVVRLHERFDIPSDITDLPEGIIIITESLGKRFALFVDCIVSKQEIVIKNLGSFLQNTEGLSGSAILGDGTIGLILDPTSLLHKSQ